MRLHKDKRTPPPLSPEDLTIFPPPRDWLPQVSDPRAKRQPDPGGPPPLLVWAMIAALGVVLVGLLWLLGRAIF
jgi:hypothetical protein